MAEGSYIPLTNEALEDFKEYLKNSVAYAEYRSGSTWYKIPIYKVETLPDGRAAIFVMFDHTAPNQITGIRFYQTCPVFGQIGRSEGTCIYRYSGKIELLNTLEGFV